MRQGRGTGGGEVNHHVIQPGSGLPHAAQVPHSQPDAVALPQTKVTASLQYLGEVLAASRLSVFESCDSLSAPLSWLMLMGSSGSGCTVVVSINRLVPCTSFPPLLARSLLSWGWGACTAVPTFNRLDLRTLLSPLLARSLLSWGWGACTAVPTFNRLDLRTLLSLLLARLLLSCWGWGCTAVTSFNRLDLTVFLARILRAFVWRAGLSWERLCPFSFLRLVHTYLGCGSGLCRGGQQRG